MFLPPFGCRIITVHILLPRAPCTVPQHMYDSVRRLWPVQLVHAIPGGSVFAARKLSVAKLVWPEKLIKETLNSCAAAHRKGMSFCFGLKIGWNRIRRNRCAEWTNAWACATIATWGSVFWCLIWNFLYRVRYKFAGADFRFCTSFIQIAD